MYAKHNGDNAKLRIFFFIPQQQRKQATKQTQLEQPKQRHQRGYWDNPNSGVFIFKFQPILKNSFSTNFVNFIHHQFVHFVDAEKPVRGLMNNFVHFIHPYMNPLPMYFNFTTFLTGNGNLKWKNLCSVPFKQILRRYSTYSVLHR